MDADRGSPTLSTTTFDDVQSDAQEQEVSTSTQKPKRPKNKVCSVCGDKALGHNFNAITCESCKAFFRRNAFKNFKGRCEGKCEINIETRSYCKRCRLQKCLNVGMKKDLILNDEQRQQRRLKIEENRMRKGCPQYGVVTQSYMTSPTELSAPPMHMASTSGHVSSGSMECSPPHLPQMPRETNLMPMVPPSSGQDMYQTAYMPLAQTTQLPPQQTQPPQPPLHQQQHLQQTEPPQEVVMDSPKSKVEALPSNEVTDNPDTPPANIDFPLDEESQKLIDELQTAYNNAFMAKADLQEPNSTVHFINLAEGSVRRLVKMVKHIQAFKRLEQKDQIALLKGGVVEILIMRSSKYFDPDTKSWRVPVANSNPRMRLAPDILQSHSEESKKLFGQYAAFASSLQMLTQNDHPTMLILIALSIFSPDRCNLDCRDLVSRIQEKYAACLKGYVQQRFGNSRQMFPRLVQKLADIRELNESHGRVLQIVAPKQLEPLLIEIFDLSC